MKAKDYFDKYGERLKDPSTTNKALFELMRDFAVESEELMDKRRVGSGRANFAILNEMNNKWNALANMFDPPVLMRNGWRDYIMTCLEELEKK